jgi:hypothetical protein
MGCGGSTASLHGKNPVALPVGNFGGQIINGVRFFTEDEVKKHTKHSDCYTILHGKVMY